MMDVLLVEDSKPAHCALQKMKETEKEHRGSLVPYLLEARTRIMMIMHERSDSLGFILVQYRLCDVYYTSWTADGLCS